MLPGYVFNLCLIIWLFIPIPFLSLAGLPVYGVQDRQPEASPGGVGSAFTCQVPFFQERLSSADPLIRKRVLEELSMIMLIPEPAYVQFLKLMLQDSDPGIRGLAIHKLYDLFIDIPLKDLPTTFTGYHAAQLIDLEDSGTVPALMKSCSQGGLGSGYAAYALGLIRSRPARECLIQAGNKESNYFVRYASARALLAIGENDEAQKILVTMIHEIEQAYATDRPTTEDKPADPQLEQRRSPFYMIVACRCLLEISRQRALDGLVSFFALLEQSSNPNDMANMHYLRMVLAEVSHLFFANAGEARLWLATRETGDQKSNSTP